MTSRTIRPHRVSLLAGLLCLLSGLGHPIWAAEAHCTPIVESATTVLKRHWTQRGNTTVRIAIPPPGTDQGLFIRVTERGVDVDVQFQGSKGELGRTDNPIERDASQHAFFATAQDIPTEVTIRAKEPGT